MSFRDRLAKSRASFSEKMNLLFNRGPELDEDFWDDLEETLILSDLGAQATQEIIERLKDQAKRKALPDANAVLDLLAQTIEGMFVGVDDVDGAGADGAGGAADAADTGAAAAGEGTGEGAAGGGTDEGAAGGEAAASMFGGTGEDVGTVDGAGASNAAAAPGATSAPSANPFKMDKVIVLFVGINGAGKTTTVGKLAHQAKSAGKNVLIGSADTFRAAAIEQLDEWGARAGVEVVKRERGADPASVCYEVVERAEAAGSDIVLIDTSGRLHTSDDLMRELSKIVNVTKKRAKVPVKTVLVLDSTTGQNGLIQAQSFNDALDLDGVIMTKLDGTAKGGIAVAVSHDLGLPIFCVGVGEGIEDLQAFIARDYAEALFGEMRKE